MNRYKYLNNKWKKDRLWNRNADRLARVLNRWTYPFLLIIILLEKLQLDAMKTLLIRGQLLVKQLRLCHRVRLGLETLRKVFINYRSNLNLKIIIYQSWKRELSISLRARESLKSWSWMNWLICLNNSCTKMRVPDHLFSIDSFSCPKNLRKNSSLSILSSLPIEASLEQQHHYLNLPVWVQSHLLEKNFKIYQDPRQIKAIELNLLIKLNHLCDLVLETWNLPLYLIAKCADTINQWICKKTNNKLHYQIKL